MPQSKIKDNISAAKSTPNDTDDALKQLNKEIAWCVDKLRMGVFTKNPNKKQVEDSSRFIKILTSQKAPLIKKRQVMRQVFGDYRSKIEKEESKWENDTVKMMKKVRISQASNCHATETNTFIRAAVSKSKNNLPNELNETENVVKENNFCFNFDIDEE